VSKFVNFVGFQVGWFACVLGATRGWPWIGPAYVLAWCAWCVRSAKRPLRTALATLLVGALGALVGWIELDRGWLNFVGAAPLPQLPPPWILALWLLFATTFDSSLAWVTRRAWTTALFSLIGAPLSYLAGERLGALSILEPRTNSMLGIGVLWAVAVSGAAWLHRRIVAQT